MILQDLFYHLWLYSAIFWEQIKINWEAWEKGMRKIFTNASLISPAEFKRLYHYPYY
jgi:hypothetical protein